MNSRQRYRMRRMAEHNSAKSERQSYIKRIDSAFTRLSEGCSKRVVRAVAASEDKSTPDYHQQLESRSEAIERRNKRIWYKQPGERGVTCSGRQKLKLSSKPLI
ncbi:transcriptional regulator [Pluralibacter gergoviae]|uniref:transcriptional regulator n=1 Tax=Pluralibacter gergoviae TaxID=61647 RepID=UPI001FF3BA98|nr:transcriptional regulator [Pluralibacter gergoviae]MCK1065039.1 transcriptional regulator [Pluralibacter gergoviae]